MKHRVRPVVRSSRVRAAVFAAGLITSCVGSGCARSHTLDADAGDGLADGGAATEGGPLDGGGDACFDAFGVTCEAFEEGYLKASNPDEEDRFGRAVALSGDTLVIGASNEDSAATGVDGDQANDAAFNAGAVYVFARTAGVWRQQAYLKASNMEASDSFGVDVAISGDTLVVGACWEDGGTSGVGGDQTSNTSEDSGAVYVFTRTAGVWSQQAYLKASNVHPTTDGVGDAFGTKVAIEDDTLVVSAPFEDSAATGVGGDQTSNAAEKSGAVYVFTRVNGTWSQQAYLKASNGESEDGFGDSIALSGETLVVGAPWEDSASTQINGDQSNNEGTNNGAAYVFTRSGSTWTQQAYLKADNAGRGDRFGRSVAIFDDTLAVGAPNESSASVGVNGSRDNDAAPGAGAVYVFTRSGAAWSQQAYVKASNTARGAMFGASVALFGDMLAVGAWREGGPLRGLHDNGPSAGAEDSGAAYVFTRTAGVWRQLVYLKASNADPGDFFGNYLALSDTTLAVSGHNESSSAMGVNGDQTNNETLDSGAVYVRRIAP